MTQPTSAELVAVSKLVADKAAAAARAELGPGEYPVDVTLRVQGTLRVAPDTEARATSSLLNEDFLVLVLAYAGITRDAATKALEATAQAYLAEWDATNGSAKAAKAAREALVNAHGGAADVRATLAALKDRLPRVPRKGAAALAGTVALVARDGVPCDAPAAAPDAAQRSA